MNIKFSYLYRDASNYKNYNTIIFSNPNCHKLEKVELDIKNNLIDNAYFEAIKILIPELFFETQNVDDHDWHEFIQLENTTENITDLKKRTIDIFIQDIMSYHKNIL
jgi:hypothetical protein